MRAQTQQQMKGRGGPSRVNAQQAIFQLKHKVVLSLNKLSDRDTCQLGVAELEKLARSLNPDAISPFLSCILDTNTEPKSAVRKECVRLFATLARFHDHLLAPHLNKMVASIVKRLKDPDSVVRDACVETVGVLASKLGNRGAQSDDDAFVTLVKPLFEALGEQNKQVQSGSALCLAKVIDNTSYPPIPILQRMLTRTTKLLRNPHFMAKPALLELTRSIIQAGGATTENLLLVAIGGIQEALKNSDWSTRKAASVALAEIASSGGSFLGTLKTSCICSLESCRFDKVKPVRDTVLQALQNWRSLPGPGSPQSSEAISFRKENFRGGDYSDATSCTSFRRKDALLKKVVTDSSNRAQFSARETRQKFEECSQHAKAEDWHIEIAIPKKRPVSLDDYHNEESEGSSITKGLDRVSTEVLSVRDLAYMDDKHESSSISNALIDNYETKLEIMSHDRLKDGNKFGSQLSVTEETTSHDEICLTKTSDRRSLDSTVTESGTQIVHGCLQMACEVSSIRKQLSDIERKQSNLLDMLQVFTTSTADSLSMLRSKILDLEQKVDRIGQDFANGGRYPDSVRSSVTRQSQIISPRLSSCTPRTSLDISSGYMQNTKILEEKAHGKSESRKPGTEIWTNSMVNISRNPAGKDIKKRLGMQVMDYSQRRNTTALFAPPTSANSRNSVMETRRSLWKRVNVLLCEGDIDSAYVEALCSGDELLLIELLEKTGPVLENLSPQTASDVLGSLATLFLEKKLMNLILPWLEQLVDLSTIRGPSFLAVPSKTRRQLLSVIEQCVNMEFSSPEESALARLAVKLHQLWGNCL